MPEPRQRGEDVFGDAVGEEFLVGVAAHVGEWQDRDAAAVRPGRQRRLPTLGLGGGGGGRRGKQLVGPHGLGEIVDRLFPQILKPERDLALHLVMDVAGQDDAARLRELLQPGGELTPSP